MVYRILKYDSQLNECYMADFKELTSFGWFGRNVGEIGATILYFGVIKDVYKADGLIGAVKHECKSTFYSTLYRINNFLQFLNPFEPLTYRQYRHNIDIRHEGILTGRYSDNIY